MSYNEDDQKVTYDVEFGSIKRTIKAGNPYQACISLLTDITDKHIYKFFRVTQLSPRLPTEYIALSTILEIMMAANNP